MQFWIGLTGRPQATAEECRGARIQRALDAMRSGVRVTVEGQDEVLRALLATASDAQLDELERMWRLGGLGWPTASQVVVILATVLAGSSGQAVPVRARSSGPIAAVRRWFWRRWLMLVGIVSAMLAGLIDFWNGFQVGRRVVGLMVTLLGEFVR